MVKVTVIFTQEKKVEKKWNLFFKALHAFNYEGVRKNLHLPHEKFADETSPKLWSCTSLLAFLQIN